MPDEDRERLQRLKSNLDRRAQVFHLTRSFFRRRGFLEVDTPTRMPFVAPESQITPVTSEGWYLSTSPELHMKRLLAAGYEKIFQISHCFRSQERGRWHNPEFNLLEWYRAGGDYMQMMRDTEALVTSIAKRLNSTTDITYHGQPVSLATPWPRITVRDAFLRHAGWDPSVSNEPLRFDDDLLFKVLPSLPQARPVILTDYPATMASLSRLKPEDRTVAERAEVFVCGLELANAFTELTDTREQRRRFEEEIVQIRRTQDRTAAMPEQFLTAMSHLPPSGGIALGMDRLVMLFCDAASIDEVMPFTVDTA